MGAGRFLRFAAFGVAGAALVVIAAIAVLILIESSKSPAERRQEWLAREYALTASGAVILREFPEEYESVFNATWTLFETENVTLELRKKTADAGLNIRRKYGRYVEQASDASIRNALSHYVSMLQRMKTNSVATCNNTLVLGAGMSGEPASKEEFEAVDAAGAAAMEAMADGRAHATLREKASPEDFKAFGAALANNRLTSDDLEKFGNTSIDYWDCQVALVFYATALSLKGEGGNRIRSYLLGKMTSLDRPTASSE
ncbi:MAG: hypothetical protein QM773_10100 [Hyphomonadaceae bacterium]